MLLFRNAGEPLIFNIVDVSIEEQAELTKLILEHGGEVTDDEECIVKFTRRRHNQRRYPRAQVYDVSYITQCIKESKLVNLESYRIGQQKSNDHCSVAHFLHGHCKCWEERAQLHDANSNISTLNSKEALLVPWPISGSTE